MTLRALSEPRRRGMLLDVTVFLVNLAAMRILAREFVRVARDATAGGAAAQVALAVFFLALLLLPMAASVLKRWRFHQRRDAAAAEARAWGCLLNPAFYLAVSLTVATAVAVLFVDRAFGADANDRAEVFLPTMLAVVVFSIVQTILVYGYFSPPRRPPPPFFRGARAAAIGDACVFVNVLLFQVLWTVALPGRFTPVHGVADVLGRLFFLWFLSILVYFPPRIFYLAEDIHRPASWGTMTLAVAPLLLRVMGVLG